MAKADVFSKLASFRRVNGPDSLANPQEYGLRELNMTLKDQCMSTQTKWTFPAQVHQQYDQVHEESEAKQARLNRLGEEIRTADQQYVNKGGATVQDFKNGLVKDQEVKGLVASATPVIT